MGTKMKTNYIKADELGDLLSKVFKRVGIKLTWSIENGIIPGSSIVIPGVRILDFRWDIIEDGIPIAHGIKQDVGDYAEKDFLKLEFLMRKLAHGQIERLL